MHSTTPMIYIALGSNIEPEKNLQEAVDMLRDRCTVLAVSSVYQTKPFGNTDQPDFLDIAVKLTTPILPIAFKGTLDDIEAALGRSRVDQANPFGPLTLDIDILLWGESAFSFGKKPWRVPHASILEQAAVAIPLAEIAPDVLHPTENVTLTEIARRFQDTDAVRLHHLTIL